MNSKLDHSTINGLACFTNFENGAPVFAATDESLLVSRDGEKTWHDPLAQLRGGEPVVVTAVACIDQPGGPGLVLAGIPGGILRSVDQGSTWQSTTLASPAPVVTALAGFTPRHLLAGTAQDGIFLSRDAGQTWARWNFGLLDVHVYSLAALEWQDGSQAIFAGTESGIFSSSGLGRAWHELDFPMDAAPVLCLHPLRGAGALDGLVFAGTETGSLFRSTDRGVSWEQVGQGVFTDEISALVQAGSGLVAASGSRLWLSRDEGKTWEVHCEVDEKGHAGEAFLCLASQRSQAPGAKLLAGTSQGSVHHIELPL